MRRSSSRAARVATVGLALAAAIATPLALTGCDNGSKGTEESSSQAKNAETEKDSNVVTKVDKDDPYASGVHHATLTVEGYDPVQITLDADKAPITVSNFCKLANDGYYDGLTFYRFQDGFCMQGGTKGNTASGNDTPGGGMAPRGIARAVRSRSSSAPSDIRQGAATSLSRRRCAAARRGCSAS